MSLSRDLLNMCVTDIIDILIYSNTVEQHVHQVHQVLSCLLQHQLYVKAEKCKFHKTSISFLEYVFSDLGIEMDTMNVWAVTEWLVPTSIKQLLGFANYRQYIQMYSSVAAALTTLLGGKPRKLKKAALHSKGFQESKIQVDLSVRSPWSQSSIFFHKLSTAEANYDGNRELLSIKEDLEEWRHWLNGAQHPLQVITVHKILE